MKILVPVIAPITQYFGNHLYWDGKPVYGPAGHPGLDFGVSVGTPIKACYDGQVVNVSDRGDGYGNLVILYHEVSPNGEFFSLYGHNSKFECKVGDYIRTGEIISLSGGKPGSPGAGTSNGPHLHFGMQINGVNINPLNFLTDNIEEVTMKLTIEIVDRLFWAILRRKPDEGAYKHYVGRVMSIIDLACELGDSREHTNTWNEAQKWIEYASSIKDVTESPKAFEYVLIEEPLYRKK